MPNESELIKQLKKENEELRADIIFWVKKYHEECDKNLKCRNNLLGEYENLLEEYEKLKKQLNKKLNEKI